MEGLWTAEFQSGVGGAGSGVVVVRNGTIMGGDAGYYYTGTYSVDDGKVQVALQIQRYREGHKSVFGPADNLRLTLSGSVDGSRMNLTGQVMGIEIIVGATKVESF